MTRIFKIAILLMALCFNTVLLAQTDKQKQLEAKRQQLQKDLTKINNLLFSNRKKEKSVLNMVEDLNYKISVRQNLIEITNEQANLLTREINNNQNQISNLRNQLQQLKDDYAAMIVKSYKSKSQQSRVMFLLSSDNFKQAYKRLQYMQQYADYQKQQGEAIKEKTETLQALNVTLLKQKEDKQKLIEDNRKAKVELEKDLKAQTTLMASIKNDLKKFAEQVKAKQQEIDRIDAEIKKLIREAIASSNKASGNTTNTGKFVLTPAGKALAANFVANKGKLPWPVERGVIKMRYGNQRSLIDKNVTIKSNGVRIATEPNAAVKSVFEGEVFAVQLSKYSNPSVYIKHGNYISVYTNLSKIFVKKGDKVNTGQTIGEVFTDASGESLLRFSIFKEDQTENPELWLAK
jgi:septal ring factor EnvC (AmiA/AmiB activator)